MQQKSRTVGLSLALLIITIVAFRSSERPGPASLEASPLTAPLLPVDDKEAELSRLPYLEDTDLIKGDDERIGVEFHTEDPPSPMVEEEPVEEYGRLRMKILDSVTLEPLTEYMLSLALASAPQSKLFAVTPQNLPDLEIPVGEYIGALFHPGYDLQSVGTFTVIDEEPTDLGVIYLERGSAVVEVRVIAPTALLSNVQSIDLHATGRWPGPCCEGTLQSNGQPPSKDGHCALCGYGSTFSRLTYKPGRLIRFESLSSGPMKLILRGVNDSILAYNSIEIEAREHRSVTLEISEKSVEIRLIDENDEPFDGLWVEEMDIFVAPIQFNILVDNVVVAVAEIAPAMELGEELNVGAFPVSGDAGDHPSMDPEVSPNPLRALWPKALTTPAGINPGVTRVSRIGPGVYRMPNIPTASDSALVACGPFADLNATPFEVEGKKEVVTIKIDKRCALSSRQFMSGPKFNSCAGCHGQ